MIGQEKRMNESELVKFAECKLERIKNRGGQSVFLWIDMVFEELNK